MDLSDAHYRKFDTDRNCLICDREVGSYDMYCTCSPSNKNHSTSCYFIVCLNCLVTCENEMLELVAQGHDVSYWYRGFTRYDNNVVSESEMCRENGAGVTQATYLDHL